MKAGASTTRLSKVEFSAGQRPRGSNATLRSSHADRPSQVSHSKLSSVGPSRSPSSVRPTSSRENSRRQNSSIVPSERLDEDGGPAGRRGKRANSLTVSKTKSNVSHSERDDVGGDLLKLPSGPASGYLGRDAQRTLIWLRHHCAYLCDSWRLQILTTALTFWALFGDDLRLAAFAHRFDILFNLITMMCILIFTFEIFVSCFGQEEYFLGFFFYLDVGSTTTLLLDLTWIGNALFCSTSDDSGSVNTSRQSRLAAKAIRTVRIIRLMRLVKLYKAYRAALEHKKATEKAQKEATARAESPSSVAPGEGEDVDQLSNEDVDADDRVADRNSVGSDTLEATPAGPQDANKAETRVGKKLSDMTTRRVIILVLIMLFIMPLFSPTQYGKDDFTHSANYGAELVYERLRRWCLLPDGTPTPWCLAGETGNEWDINPSNDPNHSQRAAARERYEKAMLRFAYNHHIGTDFLWRLYWMGFNSTSLVASAEGNSYEDREQQARAYLGQLAKVSNASMAQWDSMFVNQEWKIDITPLSTSIKKALTYDWRQQCLNYVGIPMQPGVEAETADACSITEDLRCSEVEYYVPLAKSTSEGEHISIVFAFDSRATTQMEAALSILQTVFICFAVGLGAMTFSNDANELLLNPIERMIAKMETIKDNPLEAMRLGDLEYRREEIELAKRKDHLAQMGRCWKLIYKYKYLKKVKEPMETVMLEKTIIKLGGLLALGFGEAGAEVIGQNMKGGHSAGVNAMVPGQMVDAIIGVATIRNFLEATEVLKEKVMLFVNQVAEIVHGCVDDYHGAPNKNIGESFLLVWRLSGVEPLKQTKVADMAIMSFVRIVAEVNKSRVLAVYRGHPGLLQRLPAFRVQLGFGLHCGWAIEGAIGSEFKIDASYLSPNVSVSTKLQRATTIYGVWMLISHEMIDLCSQEMALMCRLIDHTLVKGSRNPVRLYTIDLDCCALAVVPKPHEQVIRNRFKMRQLRELRKADKWSDEYTVWAQFTIDQDLLTMRAKYSAEFFHRFSMAYRNYEAGEWMAARDMLFTCHYAPKADVGRFVVQSESEWPCDGPTLTLLKFMQRTKFEPPAGWLGYRILNDE